MKKILFICIGLIAILLSSCGGNGNSSGSLTNIKAKEDMSGKVNVLTQAKPTLMIIPSDQCLQRSGFVKAIELNGRTVMERDINGFLMKDETNKQIIRAIQNYFVEQEYPLSDLEQSLKSLNNQENIDAADGLAKDAKTLLISTCRPDVILEIDYSSKQTLATRTSVKTTTSFSIAAIDAFTNKTVSSFSNPSIDNSIVEYVSIGMQKDIPSFMDQIKTYFKDIIVNGREITFRVAIDKDCGINLTDEFNNDCDTYADWIREWIKVNAKNGTANLQRNTAKEMYYTSVRISNLAEDGTQFNAYDFANIFRKAFTQTFKIKCQNSTQGLGDASIIIK